MKAIINSDGTYTIDDVIQTLDSSGNTVSIPQSLGIFTIDGLQTDKFNLTNMLADVQAKLDAIGCLNPSNINPS